MDSAIGVVGALVDAWAGRMDPWILQPEESVVGASIRSKHGQVVMNSPSTSSLIEPGPTMAHVPLAAFLHCRPVHRDELQ